MEDVSNPPETGEQEQAVQPGTPTEKAEPAGMLYSFEQALLSRPRFRQDALAILDLVKGFAWWRLWSQLGWHDIRKRYRRSVIGPFWLTISTAIWLAALGFVFGRLLGTRDPEFIPFLSAGFLAWGLISGSILDGCEVFISAENFIKQIKVPHSIFVFRVVWRNLIIFAHNIVVFVGVAVVYRIWPGYYLLLLIPGLLLLTVNTVWISIALGLLSTRYRDVSQIISSLIQVFFFLTPIIWKPEMLGDRMVYLEANPFFHFVQLVREPMLGHSPTAHTWLAAIGFAVVGWIGTFFFFRRYRSRVAAWL